MPFAHHGRFDDIYLGLVAQKAGVNPLHTDYIHFWEQAYSPSDFRHVVAAHGFHEPSRLLAVWNEQHGLGQA